jgi:predicted ATPase
VRAAVVRRGGTVITLGPLPETDVATLVTAMVGAPPGEMLRRLTARAAGNPLYVRELVDALVREQAVEIRPTAEVSVAREQLPASLTAVLSDRLSSVPAETAQMLRTAAMLGAHPHQARRERPGRYRPRGAAPGHLRVAATAATTYVS